MVLKGSESKEQLADEVMQTVVEKLNRHKHSAAGWGRTIDLIFNDIGICYKLKFDMDGTASTVKIPVSQMKESDAVASVTFDNVETWKGIVEGKIDPIEALDSGWMRLGGDMNALYKLMPAIG